ncbi:MAG: hypothetical protein Q9182_006290 [Xanthomendoza sp. 2 TL-2023]
MKIYNHLTAALGLLSAFPGDSTGLGVPPRNIGAAPPPSNVGVSPATNSTEQLSAHHEFPKVKRMMYYCSSDAAFFEPTKDNFFAANAGREYINFIIGSDRNSVEWTNRTSEPAFFAEKILGWKDFDCGPGYHGCHEEPSCDEVLTTVIGLGGDKDRARWIYFILKSISNLSLITAVVGEQSVPAQVDVASMADSMAHTFFWKHDYSVDRKCAMLAGIVKGFIAAAFAVLGALVAPVAAPAAVGVGAALQGTESVVVNTVTKSSPYIMATLKNGVRTWTKEARQNKVLERGVGIASNFESNLSGDLIETAICKNFANAPKGLEKEAQIYINKLISDNEEDYRHFIHRTNAELIAGAGFGVNGDVIPGDTTVLGEILQYGDYLVLNTEQHKRFVLEPSLIETEMKNYFKNAVISVILEEQMCYIQCSSTKPKKSGRSSFEPEPGRFCEAKCWQNWKGAKTLELFGLDELVKEHNDWNLEIQEFLKASYDHYKANGLGQGQMLPSVGTLFEGKLKSTSGSFLPVCDSPLPHRDDSIPCMCGDEYGSETNAFWNETNFASWGASRSNGLVEKSGDSPAYQCMATLADLAVLPVPYFLNLCNMGTHWPYKSEHGLMGDKHNFLVKGRDEISCDAFQGSVDIWHRRPADMWSGQNDAKDENCYMCYYSEVGQLLKNDQEKTIRSLRGKDIQVSNYNFAQACKEMRHARKFPGGDLRNCRSSNFPDSGDGIR